MSRRGRSWAASSGIRPWKSGCRAGSGRRKSRDLCTRTLAAGTRGRPRCSVRVSGALGPQDALTARIHADRQRPALAKTMAPRSCRRRAVEWLGGPPLRRSPEAPRRTAAAMSWSCAGPTRRNRTRSTHSRRLLVRVEQDEPQRFRAARVEEPDEPLPARPSPPPSSAPLTAARRRGPAGQCCGGSHQKRSMCPLASRDRLIRAPRNAQGRGR